MSLKINVLKENTEDIPISGSSREETERYSRRLRSERSRESMEGEKLRPRGCSAISIVLIIFRQDSAKLPNFTPLQNSPKLQLWGGHIPSDPAGEASQAVTDSHLYFLLEKSRHIAESERIVIWFNGGPGCSSFDGLMMEIGAWRMNSRVNETSESYPSMYEVDRGQTWSEFAHVLYLDQPVGTGFSYANTNSYTQNLEQAAAHVVQFLENFYEIFPEYRSMPTFLAGESFAGMFIPYIAQAILDSTNTDINLEGLMIGNGWIDPEHQYPATVEFARAKGLVEVGSEVEKKLLNGAANCQKLVDHQIEAGGFVPIHINACEDLLSLAAASSKQVIDDKKMCLNVYDIRLLDYSPACGMNWPPELSDVYEYLRRDDVKSLLHASRKTSQWEECSNSVSRNLAGKNSKPSVHLLPEILEKIPILIFAGDQDFICNTMGQESMLAHLTWNGGTGFENEPIEEWSLSGKAVGEWQHSRNLTWVKIYNASHMAPYDAPEASLDMALRFMKVNVTSGTGGILKFHSKVGNHKVLTGDDPNSANKPNTISGSGKSGFPLGSMLLFILIIGGGIIIYIHYLRSRKRTESRATRVQQAADDEEMVGLTDLSSNRREPDSMFRIDDEDRDGR